MDDQPTCGKGLAEHSALPAMLGALMASVAEVLEHHLPALDMSDANSRREHQAYRTLATAHRQIAARLEATAREMAGYRDLPMGRHDMTAMVDPANVTAFSKFVTLEQELVAQLQARLERDRQMLGVMGGAGDAKLPPSR